MVGCYPVEITATCSEIIVYHMSKHPLINGGNVDEEGCAYLLKKGVTAFGK